MSLKTVKWKQSRKEQNTKGNQARRRWALTTLAEAEAEQIGHDLTARIPRAGTRTETYGASPPPGVPVPSSPPQSHAVRERERRARDGKGGKRKKQAGRSLTVRERSHCGGAVRPSRWALSYSLPVACSVTLFLGVRARSLGRRRATTPVAFTPHPIWCRTAYHRTGPTRQV